MSSASAPDSGVAGSLPAAGVPSASNAAPARSHDGTRTEVATSSSHGREPAASPLPSAPGDVTAPTAPHNAAADAVVLQGDTAADGHTQDPTAPVPSPRLSVADVSVTGVGNTREGGVHTNAAEHAAAAVDEHAPPAQPHPTPSAVAGGAVAEERKQDPVAPATATTGHDGDAEGKEGSDGDAKKGRGWLHLAVDAGVLFWCFVLPIIAASVRELDPASGTTTCVFTTPVVNDSATIVLQILQNTSTCVDGSCAVQCTERDPELFLPLSRGWKVMLGLIPIVVVFEGILSFQLSSRYVAPFSMVYTILLGCFFFRDAQFYASNPTIPGVLGGATLIVVDRFFWAVVEYVFNVFAAFFFMRVLELWGLVENMRVEFVALAKSPTRKVVVVGFSFAILLAVVAPGGSNYIVAGAILIEMNPSNLKGAARADSNFRIGTICLFGNALISAFNLLGICITTIAEDIQELAIDHPNDVDYGAIQVGRLFSIQFFLFATFTPLIMACMYSRVQGVRAKLRALKPELPMLLSVGFVYAAVQLLTAWFAGPELPCMTAGGLSLAWYIVMERWGNLSLPSLKGRGYMLPFIVLIAVLLLMRLIPFVEDAVTGKWGDGDDAAAVLDPWVWNVQSGGLSFKRTFPWLWHSGVIVTAVALATPFMTDYVPPPPKRDGDDDESDSDSDVEKGTAKQGAGPATLGSVAMKAPSPTTTLTVSSLPLDDGTLSPWVTGTTSGRPALASAHAARRLRTIAHMARIWTAMSREAHAQHKKNNSNQMRRHVLHTAFMEAFADVLPVVASITAFASIAKLMDSFGMIQVVADALVDGLSSAPSIYVMLMPVIGTLGSGLTGSTTTSNFLFGRLQVTTAKKLGLVSPGVNTVWEVAATNVLGASAGEIIAPMNAIVITLMKGIGGTEERLIKAVLPLAFVWLLATMATALLFIVPSDGFID